MSDDTLQHFVKSIGENSKISDKDVLHFRNLPAVVNIYKAKQQLKDVDGCNNIHNPKLSINKNYLSFEFSRNDIGDLDKFTSCIQTTCNSTKSTIQENAKNNTVVVKIKHGVSNVCKRATRY